MPDNASSVHRCAFRRLYDSELPSPRPKLYDALEGDRHSRVQAVSPQDADLWSGFSLKGLGPLVVLL